MAAVSTRNLYEAAAPSRPSSSSGDDSDAASSSSFWKEPKEEEDRLAVSSTLVNTPPSPDHKKPSSSTSSCAGCGSGITDQFIFHVHPNMQFHASCLKCVQCHIYLNETCSAFVRNGQTYCREDYERLFTAKCTRCARALGTTDLVMRAGAAVFHLDCFKCAACDRSLRTGDEYVANGPMLFCRPACNGVNQDQSLTPSLYNEDDSWESSTNLSLDPPVSNSPIFSSPKSEGTMTPMSTFPSSVPLPPAHGLPQCLPPSGLNNNLGGGGGKKSKKDKNNRQATRVRTVLNEAQLLTLKRCYNQNSRPDAIIKEQLVEMTGLNARVIRVWFQNKRCKDKKRQIAIRDSEQNAARERVMTTVRMSGVGPMMVGSPSAHVDPSLGPPLDIHHYAQWQDGCPPPMEYGGGPSGVPHPMAQQQPPPPPPGMSYTDLSSGGGMGGPPGGDVVMMQPPHFAMPLHHQQPPLPPPPPFGALHHPGAFSPHILSDLSSPSCSE